MFLFFGMRRQRLSRRSSVLKGYLANGLFSQADRDFNTKIAHELRKLNIGVDLSLYVPQENFSINDKNAFASCEDIFIADTNKLQEADFVVAVIDGVEIDSGVAFEMGMARAWNKPILALYTDVRQLGHNSPAKLAAIETDPLENDIMYRNKFVIGGIQFKGLVASNIEELCINVKAILGEKE